MQLGVSQNRSRVNPSDHCVVPFLKFPVLSRKICPDSPLVYQDLAIDFLLSGFLSPRLLGTNGQFCRWRYALDRQFLGGLQQQATTGECTRTAMYARESPSSNSTT